MVATVCPKCKYDLEEYYNNALFKSHGENEYVQIINMCSNLMGVDGFDWQVKCTCPKCNTSFEFEDSDY